jgi:hypothetical protein
VDGGGDEPPTDDTSGDPAAGAAGAAGGTKAQPAIRASAIAAQAKEWPRADEIEVGCILMIVTTVPGAARASPVTA